MILDAIFWMMQLAISLMVIFAVTAFVVFAFGGSVDRGQGD